MTLEYNKWRNIFLPLPSVLFMMAYVILLNFSTSNGTPPTFIDQAMLMFLVIVFMVIPFDIVRWFCYGKKKYKKKATKRAELLVNEMQRHIRLINSTTDETTFNGCFDHLKEIFREMIAFESYVNFEGSPRKELELLEIKKSSAREELLKRQAYAIKSVVLPDYLDPLFLDVGRAIISNNKASIGMIQRLFQIGFNRASRIMDQLCNYGVIGEEEGTRPRKILMNTPQFEMLVYECLNNNTDTIQDTSSHPETVAFDNMNGHDFEHFCADILRKNGFTNVEVTPGSGDHGIDLLAEKDDVTFAIQCKCYSSNVGNSAVQQAHTGKSLYRRDVAVVMTNRYFTQQAKDEAAQLHVKLWDRDKLNELIRN